jgi:hypothetical protein
MTDPGKVLLSLISYASERGKPAVLNVRPKTISLLCAAGLIEEREGGYWITELGRGAAYAPGTLDQFLPHIQTELVGSGVTVYPSDQRHPMVAEKR